MDLQKEQPADEAWLERIAGLACIRLTGDEIRMYAAELKQMLSALDGMNAPADGTAELSDGIPETDLREDTAGPCLPREKLLSASDSEDGAYFLIPHGREPWGGTV